VQKQKWNNFKKKIYSDAIKSRSSVKFDAEKYQRPKTTTASQVSQLSANDLTSTSKLTFTDSTYRNASGLSGSELIRNNRGHVKSDLHSISQKFNFHLSNEIVTQRRSAVYEAHAGKSRLRF
jgi:hypothetical protein